eukprot:m.179890 g.179890  ORF g.179890 m.179890 type:complete len:286 (-) comp16605_c0_seq4:150-1007(-)
MNNSTGAVLDDTREMFTGPFELRIGKKFLIDEWETVVKSMTIGERCAFDASDDAVQVYPQLARVLRKESEKKHAEAHGHEYHDAGPTHGCFHHVAHDLHNTDLLELGPGLLSMEFELLSVIKSDTFEKEIWEMSLAEKLAEMPKLKEQGKQYFQDKNYEQAADRYMRTLAIIESLTNQKELDPDLLSDEQISQIKTDKPMFLSNLAACELALKDYPKAIEYCTMGLDLDPTHVKLLYRRAKVRKVPQPVFEKRLFWSFARLTFIDATMSVPLVAPSSPFYFAHTL